MLQDPLFLDLIGTCHSDSTKPVILTPQHLTFYRTHLARGLTLYPPDILTAMLKERTLQRDSNGTLMLPPEVSGSLWASVVLAPGVKAFPSFLGFLGNPESSKLCGHSCSGVSCVQLLQLCPRGGAEEGSGEKNCT